MLGVAVNAAAIVAGSLVGLLFKDFLTERLSRTIRTALGIVTVAIGLKMALRFEHVLLVVGCVAGGGVLGALWELEARIERLGGWAQRRFSGSAGDNRFAVGFATTSILYCVGAMAVVGAIESGTSGNHEVLFAKSALDGVISVTFAAIYGIGVAFSAVSVFLYQGAVALLAPKMTALTRPGVLNDLSGVGGILVVMIGLSVSEVKKIPVGDYFPAVFLAMLIAPLL
jgi:uncharacterized protein